MPAMVTYKAKGVVADDDAWFAGVFTNAAIEQPVIDESDLLIGIGLDPGRADPARLEARAAHRLLRPLARRGRARPVCRAIRRRRVTRMRRA